MSNAKNSKLKLKNDSKNQIRFLITGLDSSGKSTVIKKLKEQAAKSSIKCHLDILKLQSIVSSLSGRNKYRVIYSLYYSEADVIIYIVDASNPDTFEKACDEFDSYVLHRERMKKSFIVVFANKQDVENAMSVSEIQQRMRLNDLEEEVRVFGTSFSNDEGFSEAFKFMSKKIEKKYGEMNSNSLQDEIKKPINESIEDAKKLANLFSWKKIGSKIKSMF